MFHRWGFRAISVITLIESTGSVRSGQDMFGAVMARISLRRAAAGRRHVKACRLSRRALIKKTKGRQKAAPVISSMAATAITHCHRGTAEFWREASTRCNH